MDRHGSRGSDGSYADVLYKGSRAKRPRKSAEPGANFPRCVSSQLSLPHSYSSLVLYGQLTSSPPHGSRFSWPTSSYLQDTNSTPLSSSVLLSLQRKVSFYCCMRGNTHGTYIGVTSPTSTETLLQRSYQEPMWTTAMSATPESSTSTPNSSFNGTTDTLGISTLWA